MMGWEMEMIGHRTKMRFMLENSAACAPEAKRVTICAKKYLQGKR